jgi:hypothetical protein
VLVLAHGHAVLGQVGQGLHEFAQTFIGGGGGCFERLHLCLECAGLLGLRGGVCACSAEFGDLFGQLVALRLQGFNLGNGLAAFAVYRGKITKRGGGIHAPGAQFFLYQGQIAPYKR